MNTMKKTKVWVSLMLVMALVVLSACSSSKGNSTTASPTIATKAPESAPASTDSKLSMDPITLTVFAGNDGDVTNKGIQNNAFGDAIKKKFGITLDVITGDDVKEKTMIAGGDLPDIIVFEGSTSSLANSLIKGNQVIPLDGLIEKYGPNIKKYSQTALDVFKKSYSNDTNKIYFLPTHQQKAYTGLIGQSGYVNFLTRWDLYKEAGAPEMNNEDDFLKVMKQIQDKNPVSKDGKKVYSFSAWSDWGTWPYIITYPFSHGYGNLPNGQLLNGQNGEVEDQYAKVDGVFWNGIKFYNKAYRMGLFDPEGFTQKNSQYVDKVETGQLLNSALWKGEANLVKNTGKDDAQMITIPGPFPVLTGVYPSDAPLGWSLGTAKAITSHNKYPERTMQLLDYFNSPEGARFIYNGIKGTDWDIVDGKAKLIGEMAKPNNKAYRDSTGFTKFSKLGAFDESYPTDDGVPVDLNKLVDPAVVTKAETDFAKHYGAESYPGQVYDKLIKDGKALTMTKSWIIPNLMGQPSDATTQIFTKADQYFMANVAKFIMAKDDAGFIAAQKKAIADLQSMGIDKAYEEMHQLFIKGQATAKALNFK